MIVVVTGTLTAAALGVAVYFAYRHFTRAPSVILDPDLLK